MTVKELAAALRKLPAEDQEKPIAYRDRGTTYEIDRLLHEENVDVCGMAGAHDVVKVA